jgi:hypothetical protein
MEILTGLFIVGLYKATEKICSNSRFGFRLDIFRHCTYTWSR